MWLYGHHAVLAALANPDRRIERILAMKDVAERHATELKVRKDIKTEIMSRDAMTERLPGGAVHQGLAVLAAPLEDAVLEDVLARCADHALVLALDQVTDPHNVGAILRTCAAFNVTALVATARHSPEASAVLFKSASGAFEHVPFVKVTNLSRAMAELKDYGFRILGLDSDAPEDISAVDRAPPVAIVLGAEGKGLRQLTRDSCDHLVRLDMNGPIRSLNVSNACAVTLYALTR